MDKNDIDEFGRCTTEFKEAVVAFGAIQNLVTEVEGMKAMNQSRISNGYALAYDEASFHAVAEEIEGIAGQLDGN